jgi:hypothetical protein
MPRESDTEMRPDSHTAGGWPRGLGELLITLAIFAAAGCWPVPDVNETAYLTKARHHADPAWGRGDFFLETPDAHGVFYMLMGPLAASLSLEQAAWIGRWLGWLAVAAGFRHAVVPLLAPWWPRLLAAALFSLALRHTPAAGEWVLGGCESKVFAWALVLVAVGEIARARLPWAVLALGAATALHPLVGGWGLVALVVAVSMPAGRSLRDASMTAGKRGGALAISGGLLLAAAGLVPALGLSGDVDAAVRAAAARIYVVERLPHHLLVRTFADGFVARHVLAILAWWLLAATRPFAPEPMPAARTRAYRFIVASLVITLAGCAVSLAEPLAPAAVHGLLRYYWFRLADILVPLALAVAAAAVVSDGALLARLVPVRPAVTRWGLAALLCLDLVHESRHWPLPGRTSLVARSDGKVDAAAWRDACDWIANHAPADACVLTPRGASSLTWWTGRREVVGWKNSPQDAASLVEWRRRIVDCFSRDGGFANLERSTAALGAERMRFVADTYGATLAVVPLDLPAAAELPFERLHANKGYAVLRLAPD